VTGIQPSGKPRAGTPEPVRLSERHSDFASGAQTDLLADADDDVVMQRQAQNLAAFLNFLRH